MNECRRPIEDWERPYLNDLGIRLRLYRDEIALPRREVAWLAQLHPSQLYRIETGIRRTCRSTIERIMAVYAQVYRWDDTETAERVERLVALAGPALAPESEHAERVVRRRTKRFDRMARELELAERIAMGMARPLAREMAREYIREWRWVYANPGSRHSP